jgi:hypothetical protein
MKRFAIAAAALSLCMALPSSTEARGTKQPSVDMSNRNKIFVGWIDLDPSEYRLLDYDTKAQWVTVIDNVNSYFQDELKSEYLVGRTLTMAKNKDDVNAGDSDLYIKFTNVSEDKGYRLHIAVHFIDPKTGTELAVIPEDKYGAHLCGLEGCIEKEVSKIGELINRQVVGKK